MLRARLDHAIALYRTGIAPVLVVTGGKRAGDATTEAGAARAYAIRQGVPAAAILAEDRGTTTQTSLENAGALLRAHGLRSAVLVSDRSHVLRALRIALDQGILAWGSPTTTSPTDASPGARAEAIVHELGGLAAYFLAGRSAPD